MCCKEELCHIPITIEKMLKEYAESSEHLERHEVLWHEWNHNKRWLIQLQQLILPSFPSYSRHDVSHSQAVLHNIEMILGEENIRSLSATDCFLILHTVYVHDIGMCITHEDRETILKDRNFHDYLNEVISNGNSDMKQYAEVLLRECFKSNKTSVEEKQQYILDRKLDVYYAIIYMLAEFRRKEHGDVSKDRLLHWIDQPDKLGLGFSTIEVPERLFYIIANCAATHTKWDFDEVLKLNQEDSGFALDYAHPRFIAVLLQLGDALDMDNDRFHPLTKEYLGKIPETSERHYEKHKAIRRLRITNQKISITADCVNQEVLRLIRTECDGIEDILKNATFYWSVIKPDDSNMCLPTLDKKELLLNGKEIPADLVTSRFEISQEKAFNLLTGNNIYIEQHFVFLRELLQNAVDATKIQYFRECSRKIQQRKRMKEKALESDTLFLNPISIGKIESPLKYPIDIELCIIKYKENIYEDITQDDLKNPEEELEGYECGVLVKITDYGIGINAKDIKQISNVGSSYNSKKDEISKMPSWLQPTGTFGIGLQSAFLSGKVLKATTHPTTGEVYEITFHPRTEGNMGYINVLPGKEENMMPFGTCFEVFVPYSKKKSHKESPDTWDGKDPFEKDYEYSRPIRHSRELLKQMALYLHDMVGEALFPINLYINDPEEKGKDELYSKEFWSKMKNGTLSVWYSGELITKNEQSEEQEQSEAQPAMVTWAYNLNNDEDIFKAKNGDIYRLDMENVKLHIWNQECAAYACIGSHRILDIRNNFNSRENEELEDNVKIYYKGIHATDIRFNEDSSLIEFIDLKHTLKKEYLQLNRRGFSDAGYEYLEEVYKKVIKTARNALEYFGKQEAENTEKTSYPKRIVKKLDFLKEKKPEEFEQVALSATVLAYFAMVKEREFTLDKTDDNCAWNSMLDKIISMFDSIRNENAIKWKWKDSSLYNIPFWQEESTGFFSGNYKASIYEIISSKNKYAVVSKREGTNHSWKQYLVECKGFHQSIKCKINKLKKSTDLAEKESLIEKIDEEAKKLLTMNYSSDSTFEFTKYEKEQTIINWLSSNIPTMAIFSSKDGDTRMNVLDTEISDSIYYCQNMKYLLLERIVDLKDKAQRFSVPTLSGYEFLCLDYTRKSILFVKRGKLPKNSYNEMIFPITAEQLHSMFDNYTESSLEKRIRELYCNLVLDFAKNIPDEQGKIVTRFFERIKNECRLKPDEIEQYLHKEINNDIKTEDMNTDTKTEKMNIEDYKAVIYLLSDKQDDGSQNNMTVAGSVDNSNDVWDSKVVPLMKELMYLWYRYEKESRVSYIQLHNSPYDAYCKDNPSYINMVDYVTVHSKKKCVKEQADILYHLFLYEIENAIRHYKREVLLEELEAEKAVTVKTITDFQIAYQALKDNLYT